MSAGAQITAPRGIYQEDLNVTPPPYGPPAAASNDKTTLWGWLGIVFGLCCPPLGAIFGVLSLNEAKKHGKKPTLAYVAFGLCALSIVLNIIRFATGGYDGITGTTTP